MSTPTWKLMRKTNTNKKTVILENLELKVKLKKAIKKKREDELNLKRALQHGLRLVHNKPDRFVAIEATNVAKNGVDRISWV